MAGCGTPWALVILLFGGPTRFAAVGAAALAAGLGIAVFLFLKKRTNRKRPCAIEPHCWATLLPPDRFSFPSGHTITAFAVALSLAGFYPGLLAGSAVLRRQHRRLAHPAGHAFLERRAGRRADRLRPGVWRGLADAVNLRLGA